MIRVLLVDDQPLVRKGLVMVLQPVEGIEVVGEAADGVEAVEGVGRLLPDVVVMDVRMPRLDGIEATKQIVRRHPASRVLVLTTFDVDEHVVRHEALLYRMEVGDLHWLAVVAAK